MAHRIKSNDGGCCPCAEREGCDCGRPCVSIECRTRGGTATLVGFSEFTNPSTPPRKYLKSTWSGTRLNCDRVNPCGSSGLPDNVGYQTWSGSCVWDPATGLTTNGVSSAQRALGEAGPCTPISVNPVAAPACGATAPGGSAATQAVVTTTSNERMFDFSSYQGGCFNTITGGSRSQSGKLSIKLSEEDTDEDARDRLMAGPGGGWSSWSLCTSAPCCATTWGVRGAGEFNFAYLESEYRVTSGGNPPGWEVNMRLRFFRKATTATEYTLFSQEEITMTADGDGNATAEGVVPIAQGYDTYLATCAAVAT